MIVRITLVAAAVLLPAGCALLSPPRTEPAKAVLSELPDAVPHGRLHPASLVVLRPEASPAYDTVRMAYSEQPYQLAYFRDREWAEPPPAMIQKLMVQTLERTGSFRAVRAAPETDRSDYTLRSELQTLIQDYTRTTPMLRLAIRVELVGPSGRFLAGREFVEQEPMRDSTSYAGVVAANSALAKALQEIAELVVEQPR
jgi:cholesterol transport system auxiliary component